jgi:DNA modification methylase
MVMYTVEEITNQIFCGDARLTLQDFPENCIDMCITSPPYFQQRTYNLGDAEIGSEKDLDAYLNNLRLVFNRVKRVLKPAGTCWVNIGDAYKNGELSLIPHDFVLEMQANDWKCFNTIIWHVPNTFTGSSKKRFTQDFQYLFAFSKQDDYYFEQQYEPYKTKYKSFEYTGKGKRDYKSEGAQNPSDAKRSILKSMSCGLGRHVRCVWTIPHVSSSTHPATFPRKLVQTPIWAGCPVGGLVLDPFVGFGTSARVALESGRKYVGIDLNPKSVKMANELVNCSC